MKEWYQRWNEALLVLLWGIGALIIGIAIGKFVF